MTCGILHDQESRVGVGHVIVPPFADRDALEQIVAAIERLPQLQDVGLALQLDAELPCARALDAAVAADEILRASVPMSCCRRLTFARARCVRPARTR